MLWIRSVNFCRLVREIIMTDYACNSYANCRQFSMESSITSTLYKKPLLGFKRVTFHRHFLVEQKPAPLECPMCSLLLEKKITDNLYSVTNNISQTSPVFYVSVV